MVDGMGSGGGKSVQQALDERERQVWNIFRVICLIAALGVSYLVYTTHTTKTSRAEYQKVCVGESTDYQKLAGCKIMAEMLYPD